MSKPPHSKNQPSLQGDRAFKWQDILWREWRNCEDEEYARHLFLLIGDTSLNRSHRLIFTLVTILFGVLAGLLIDALFSPAKPDLFGWLGGLSGALLGWWLSKPLLMRSWLAILTPNNVLKDSGWLLKALLLGLIAILFISPNMVVAGLALGLLGGASLGLALGLLSWPLLGLVSLRFFPGEALTATDMVICWAGAGLGVGLGALLGMDKPNFKQYGYRAWCFWWRNRPLLTEVKQALLQADDPAGEWGNLLAQLADELASPASPAGYITMLNHRGWEERFIARQALVTLGAEAIYPLLELTGDQDGSWQRAAVWLLQSIEQETTARLAETKARPLCLRCLARCQAYTISIAFDTPMTYYGCRLCRQSRDIFDGEAVAVLDAAMTEEWTTQNDQIRINWLARQSLFDFDRVEIIQATDEEVERFAVQVGNDTDPFRQARYSQLPCLVAPECRLSENTLRILQHTFGLVEQQGAAR